jgi:hypothetical protein
VAESRHSTLTEWKGRRVVIKHINAENQAKSQKAQQAKARREKQATRGSKHFKGSSNVHRGASQSQSGQPRRGR